MSALQLTFFEESNHRKRDMLQKWVISNIDHSKVEQGFPVCFYGNTSFYLTELPDFSRWPQDFKARVFAVLMDTDMMEDLERAGVINWCRNVRIVVPIRVPKDGNCLLHSVGIAVWGIRDSNLMLRRLLGLALSVDRGRRFFDRWIYQRQIQMSQVPGSCIDFSAEHLKKEWSEISNCLDPDRSSSAAVPHRFLESIHVYTLANILRRPIIIMTDPTMRTFSGTALQDNDMGGVYLPLEWSWKDTHRTPLLLGYSHNHFAPLLFADHPNQAMAGVTQKKDLAPLVNAQLEQLPVRFLLQMEEPEVGELLRKYLKVKETVTTMGGAVQNILCAELEVCNLPDELNLVKDFFDKFQVSYRQEQALLSAQQWQQYPGMMPSHNLPGHLQNAGQQNILSQPGQQTNFSQAFGSSQRVVGEQLQGMPEHEFAMGGPALQIPNPCGQGSVRIPPPSFTPRYSFGEHNASLNPPQDKKCVVPGCKYFGDPDLGMMCSNCFKNYTIKHSRRMASSGVTRTLPSAPMASMQEEEQRYEMSMMAERCKTGCGFRCSTKTYPYCHECAGKRQKQAQKEAKARECESAGASLVNPRSWTGASGAAGSAPPHPSQLPEDVVKPLESTQHVDQNHVKATPPASPLPVSSTEPGTLKANQTSEEAAGATSPTQALAAGSLAAPLTPPDDPSDLMLFGSGEQSPIEMLAGAQPLMPAAANEAQASAVPSIQNAATVSAPATSHSHTPASSGHLMAGVASSTPQPHMPVAGEDNEGSVSRWLPSHQQEQVAQTGGVDEQNMAVGGRLPDRQNSNTGESGQQPSSSATHQKQQQQQQHQEGKEKRSHMTGQAMLSSGLTESQLAEAIVGSAQEEPVAKCANAGCGENAVHKNLCGKCYMAKGTEPTINPAVQKMKGMSLNSTSSSAPASIGVQATDPKYNYPFMNETQGTFCLPMNQIRATSLTHLPNKEPPLTANNRSYVENWLEDVRQAPACRPPAPSAQKSQPMGLPEKQESEPLPGSASELLASGEQCYSSLKCVAEGCSSKVRKLGELCDQCREILRLARLAGSQGQGQHHSPRTSVQESVPPVQCKTEGCTYWGNPEQLGFCSRCFELLFKRQEEEERRHARQTNRQISSPLPQNIPASIRVPAEFHHVPLPAGRQGQLCRAAGCNMFGDPQWNNMCSKHYHDHLAGDRTQSAPPQSATYVPPSPRRNIPYAQELTITPSGATVLTPAGGREVLFGTAEIAGSGSFPQGEVSVPPPSYPTPESGVGQMVRPQEQSLNETYSRLVNRRRCLNSPCTNYGNSSKGGLCNSCAKDQQLSDELIRRTILGDEEIG